MTLKESEPLSPEAEQLVAKVSRNQELIALMDRLAELQGYPKEEFQPLRESRMRFIAQRMVEGREAI